MMSPNEAPTILILSDDAIVAALLGALVETLGHDVRFGRPFEDPSDAMRRLRPTLCLIDCENETACNDETLGHAIMRGITVLAFGKNEALDRSRALVTRHHIATVRMPPDPIVLDATLRRALKTAGGSITL